MDIEKCRYIVVEGPIGAGKTSLARELADRLEADMSVSYTHLTLPTKRIV